MKNVKITTPVEGVVRTAQHFEDPRDEGFAQKLESEFRDFMRLEGIRQWHISYSEISEHDKDGAHFVLAFQSEYYSEGEVADCEKAEPAYITKERKASTEPYSGFVETIVWTINGGPCASRLGLEKGIRLYAEQLDLVYGDDYVTEWPGV